VLTSRSKAVGEGSCAREDTVVRPRPPRLHVGDGSSLSARLPLVVEGRGKYSDALASTRPAPAWLVPR